MENDELFISGAISGAITDPYSIEATEFAEKFYGQIRSTNGDIQRIADNTEFTVEQIAMVKNFLFIDEHILETGIERFMPDCGIAHSWQRLAYMPDDIKPHDITLIKHELMEIGLINKGYSQQEAHDITEQKYNYQQECYDYYRILNGNQMNDSEQISGAIRRHKMTH